MLDRVIAAYSCEHQETHFQERMEKSVYRLTHAKKGSNRLFHETKTQHIQAYI